MTTPENGGSPNGEEDGEGVETLNSDQHGSGAGDGGAAEPPTVVGSPAQSVGVDRVTGSPLDTGASPGSTALHLPMAHLPDLRIQVGRRLS